MRTQIFISYRRDGGLETAQQLHALLHNDYEVFFDKESLRSGLFDEKIEQAICECTDFLLILSGNIFDRFDNEGDWISRELTLALQKGKNLIPVFLPEFLEPDTDHDIIQTVMRHNGIQYANNDSFATELVSFLKSNKKCVLDIVCTEQGYKLANTAVEALKAAYQKMVYTKEYGVHIVLAFPDATQAAQMLVPMTDDPAREQTVEAVSQQLLHKHRVKRSFLELAIEFMMADTDNLTSIPLQAALCDNPLVKTVFETPGKERFNFYLVAVWVQIAEELLKEITVSVNRASYYRSNWQEYAAIDCVISRVSKQIQKQWYFGSAAPHSELTYPDQSWYPLMRPSVVELTPQTLLQFILPDFYYKVAGELLCSPSEELKALLRAPDADIRFLANYWYGLH